MGGLVGYFIGTGIDALTADKQLGAGDENIFTTSRGRYSNTGTQGDINFALLALMAAVMKSDDVVKKSELNYVKRFLVSNYGEEQAKELLLKLRDLDPHRVPLTELCQQIKYNTDYTTRYHMVDFLYGLANADGYLSPIEQKTLRHIAMRLGINMQDLMSIHARHFRQQYDTGGAQTGSSYPRGKDPYQVLGLQSTATDEEVKKAYRRYAMKYHPDKVANMSEEVRKNAEAQFREINAAYEAIKQRRGMK